MNIVILAVTALLLVPVAVFCAECLAALLPRRKKPSVDAARPAVAVVIPAHDEEKVLGATLQSLIPQLRDGDRVLVVADNCTDSTATIARELGAEVIERTDAVRRGKGYALDFGIRHLEKNAPGIVIMMDADCHVHPGALEALAAQVLETNRPAQAVYLLERPNRPGPRDLVSALAFMVKNLVRPSGLGRLGLPCLLTGTGMAFPWPIIRRAKLASGNIVEDMQLGLDLAISGHPPMFCDRALVTGRLPQQRRAAITQRTRWEHGHLSTLFTQVPRLVRCAFKQRKFCPLALALELLVPPLSLLVMIFLVAIGGTMLASRFGASKLAPNLLMGSGTLALLCLVAAWIKFGRQQLPITALLAAPFYVVWKIPLYVTFLFRPQREWVRTDRSDNHDDHDPSGGEPTNDRFPATGQPSIVDLCGLNIHAITEQQCVSTILRQSGAGRGGVVVTPNLDHLRRYRRDAEFAQLVDRADIVVADGMPLVWASRLQGTPLPCRVAGSDLISSLSSAAARNQRTVFLLGGAPGTAEAAAQILQERYSNIKIAGTYCPPVGFEQNADLMREMTAIIANARPDIVFVALGSPKQEQLIDHLRYRLPATWWLGVGISFSFLCGDVRRAPRWMRRAGLEWIHRMLQEPGRLFKRYLIQGVPFALRLLAGAMGRGIARKLGLVRRPMMTVRVDSVMGSFDVQVNSSDFEAPRNGYPKPSEKPIRVDGISMSDFGSDGALAGAGGYGATGHSPSNGNGNGNGNGAAHKSSSGGPETVYRAFLSGFASEFFTNGNDDDGNSKDAPPPTSPAPGLLKNVKAVVLLGGSVRPTKLTGAVGRSVLDLPLEDGRSILTHWRDQAAELCRRIGIDHLNVRVLVDRMSPQPRVPSPSDDVTVRIERDVTPYRGTGGVLRDLSGEYDDDDILVVANAAQALLTPLAEIVTALAEFNADVSLVAHADGTPSGLMLVRCRALRKVAKTGYVDMKEQALPLLTKEFKITHLVQTHATGLSVRSLEEYIGALQRRHRMSLGTPAPNDPFAEDRRPTFTIVEQGATIEPGARVHDSVILRGAVVEEGAMVVRSIVCPEGVVFAGQTAVDQLVMNAEVAAR